MFRPCGPPGLEAVAQSDAEAPPCSTSCQKCQWDCSVALNTRMTHSSLPRTPTLQITLGPFLIAHLLPSLLY